MKKVVSLFLVLVLMTAMLVFPAMAEEQTTLRVLWWGSQTRHDLTMAAIEKFMEKNPDIIVEAEFAAWDGYWEKVNTQISGETLADVVQMDYGYLAQYAEAGVLADLSPYLDSGVIDSTNIASSVIDSGKINGDEVYAISAGTNALVMMYRKDKPDEAGITIPMEPTRSDIVEASRAIYAATGHHGDSWLGVDPIRYYLRSYGLNFYADDGTSLGFDDPKYIADIWRAYSEAVEEGWSKDVGTLTATSTFDTLIDDSWWGTHWTNELAAYETGCGMELEMCMLPKADDATTPPTFLKPSMYWSVSEKSKVKEAAARFIDFMTNDTDCFDIVGTDRAIPISSAIRDYLSDKLDPTSQRAADMINYISQEGKTSPIMRPDIPKHGQLNSLLDQYTEEVKYGLVDDYEAHAQAYMDEANQIIRDYLNQ